MRHLWLTLAVVFTISTAGLAAAPRIAFVSPSKDQAVGGRNVEISVSYDTRSDKEVAYIELEIDGQLVQTRHLEHPRSRGICSFIWNAEEYDNGTYPIIVRIYSDSGLIGSTSGDYSVANRPPDITPPIIEFVNIRSDQICSEEIEIQVNATDDSGEPPLVSLAINQTLKLIQNNPPYKYVWNTGLYDDGKYLLEAWAVDAAGNQSVAEALSLRVKNRMEPLQLAQTIVPDEATAVVSTIVMPKPADSREPANQALAETTAVPMELPFLMLETARAPEIGEARGGNFTQLLAVEGYGPLVEFIESDHTVPEQQVVRAQPEPVMTPMVTASEQTSDTTGAPYDLELPMLGEQLATPEYISPLITHPEPPTGADQTALLPPAVHELAPAKIAEPVLSSPVEEPVAVPH